MSKKLSMPFTHLTSPENLIYDRTFFMHMDENYRLYRICYIHLLFACHLLMVDGTFFLSGAGGLIIGELFLDSCENFYFTYSVIVRVVNNYYPLRISSPISKK